ncbi:MAG: type II toxin-antitoxin system VapC family toxin [Elusimicrobia bacterium]|nr:type II toxin-antitoxin system VapC family toxin [Elusimicrobiota bacterium]
MKVLFDTSAFIALGYPKDANHAAAVDKMERLAPDRPRTFTTNAVIYETLNWVAIKMGPKQADGLWNHIRRESRMSVIALAPEDEAGALAVMKRFSQIQLSFVDASTIFLHHKLGMDRVFTFDRHFVQANVAVL